MANATLAAPEREAWSRRIRDAGFWAEWAALVGLIALVIIFEALNPTFLSPGNLQGMLVAAAILIILAVGQTFVIAAAGIDLSVASTMTLGAVCFGAAFSHRWGLPLSCAAAIVASTAVGLINGTIVARGKITDFIVTLGTLSAAAGLALIVSSGKPVTIIDPFLLRLSVGGIGILGWSFIIAAVVAVLAHGLLFNTRFGTHVLATGGSPEAAIAMGISTRRIKTAVYTISGALAGLGAILLVAGPIAILDRSGMESRARQMVATLAVNVPAVSSRVRRLSGGQRQAVSICRAAGFSSQLVIMDEPTAALGVQETARVEELIVRLRNDGHPVLLISHNFAQVLRLSDQVWVMRAGRCVAGRRTSETTGEEIVALITGAKSQ